MSCNIRCGKIRSIYLMTEYMLEYVKTILKKVSFDRGLFEKELLKAIRSLLVDEVMKLKEWCYRKFGKIHSAVLDRCFATV